MTIQFSGNKIRWTSGQNTSFQLEFPENATDRESGIAHTVDGLGLGAICVIENPNGRLVVCQKSAVKGYEFSNHLVFPGGAVRRKKDNFDRSLFQCTISSLDKRITKEAGIHIDLLNSVLASTPVFTQYTVKEVMRYMVVIPFFAKTNEQLELPATDDHTTTRVFLAVPDQQLLKQLAPANALAFANWMSARRGKKLDVGSHRKRSQQVSLEFDTQRKFGNSN